MGKKNKLRNKRELPSFSIIEAASKGDVVAINQVLAHYDNYITTLSTRKLIDEYGQQHYCVDEVLRRRLETRLITKIVKFKIA